ncbi:hypothetical protein AVEN_217603-1 [Araneus ventricosus]|uniref:Uncharacterized protein n=1 Tax=Araneus ventricosus TaxID=182803 RepID=A0A4Y2FHH0_ARAVE|nr:hypothetical protein AVEN_217603-1 [Araneus ventricosus]
MKLYQTNIPENTKHRVSRKEQHLLKSATQADSTNNNSSSTNNTIAQHLTAEQLAMRTRLQRDPPSPFISIPTERDVTCVSQEKFQILVPMIDRATVLEFSGTSILPPSRRNSLQGRDI